MLRRRDFRRLRICRDLSLWRARDVKGKCFQLELLAQNSQHFLVSLWRAPLRPRRTAQVYGRHCLSHPCRFSASDLEREPRERKDKGSYSRTRLRGFVEHDMPIGRNGKPRTSQAVHVGALCEDRDLTRGPIRGPTVCCCLSRSSPIGESAPTRTSTGHGLRHYTGQGYIS